jgi:hypothetical protein
MALYGIKALYRIITFGYNVFSDKIGGFVFYPGLQFIYNVRKINR